MKSITIISIPVTDQEAAKQFYLKLGFKLMAEAPFDTHKWIQMALPGQEMSITLVPGVETRQHTRVRNYCR